MEGSKHRGNPGLVGPGVGPQAELTLTRTMVEADTRQTTVVPGPDGTRQAPTPVVSIRPVPRPPAGVVGAEVADGVVHSLVDRSGVEGPTRGPAGPADSESRVTKPQTSVGSPVDRGQSERGPGRKDPKESLGEGRWAGVG